MPMINNKKLWVYDDSKYSDIITDPERFKNLRAFLINNWCPESADVADSLHSVGVKEVYVCYKLYSTEVDRFNYEWFADWVDKMKSLGVDGIAIDGEDYSSSSNTGIWYNNSRMPL